MRLNGPKTANGLTVTHNPTGLVCYKKRDFDADIGTHGGKTT